MKIKITQPGSESYTGFLGDVQFFGGVSVGDISEQSAAGIAAIYAIERIGDDVEQDAVATPAGADTTPTEAEKQVTVISDETPETTVEEVAAETPASTPNTQE